MYKTDFGNIVTGSQIVSLPLAKLNSVIDYDADDELLQLFLDAIALEIEDYIGYPILERDEVTIKLKHWETPYSLPIVFNSITSVNYKDTNGDLVSLAVDDEYEIFENEFNLLTDYPSAYKGPITIKGTAGFSNEEMPAHFKNAALLMFSERETFRENRPVKMNTSAKEILRPYRRH